MNCLLCKNILKQEHIGHTEYNHYMKHYCVECDFHINEYEDKMYLYILNTRSIRYLKKEKLWSISTGYTNMYSQFEFENFINNYSFDDMTGDVLMNKIKNYLLLK